MQGSGTETDPYLISTSEEFIDNCFDKEYTVHSYFKLSNDINIVDINNKGSKILRNVSIDGAGHTLKIKISEKYSLDDNAYFVYENIYSCEFIRINFDIEYNITDTEFFHCGLFSKVNINDENNKIYNKIDDCTYKLKYISNNTSSANLFIVGVNIDYIDINNFKINADIYSKCNTDIFGVYNINHSNSVSNNVFTCNTYCADEVIINNTCNYIVACDDDRDKYRSVLNNIIISGQNINLNCSTDANIDITSDKLSTTLSNSRVAGDRKVNIKTKLLKYLHYDSGDLYHEYRDNKNKDVIDVIADSVEYVAIDRAGDLTAVINTHSTIIQTIELSFSKVNGQMVGWTDVCLNKNSIIKGKTNIVANYTNTFDYYYSWLHFITDDYVDYINLFIGNAWKKILLYAEGDIPFYVSKDTILYMKFDGYVDENTRDALVYFPTANNIKAGRIIKTVDNNDL